MDSKVVRVSERNFIKVAQLAKISYGDSFDSALSRVLTQISGAKA